MRKLKNTSLKWSFTEAFSPSTIKYFCAFAGPKAITKTCPAKVGPAEPTAPCYSHGTLLKVIGCQAGKILSVILNVSEFFFLTPRNKTWRGVLCLSPIKTRID